MGTPIIEPHSCKACKRCKSKNNKFNKTFYQCNYDEKLITESVYKTNECLTFINKK